MKEHAAPRDSGEGKVLPKGAKIIIPNAENLTEEELKKAVHNEKIRRMRARKSGKSGEHGEILAPMSKQEIRKMDTEEMVEMAKGTRNMAVQLLEMKLQELYADPAQREKLNLATLATVFGILFDKTQLMNGLATENIAIQAKIDINMNSDTALQELDKMRAKYAEQNQ